MCVCVYVCARTVNGREPLPTLDAHEVQEVRRELSQIRDKVNIILDSLDGRESARGRPPKPTHNAPTPQPESPVTKTEGICIYMNACTCISQTLHTAVMEYPRVWAGVVVPTMFTSPVPSSALPVTMCHVIFLTPSLLPFLPCPSFPSSLPFTLLLHLPSLFPPSLPLSLPPPPSLPPSFPPSHPPSLSLPPSFSPSFLPSLPPSFIPSLPLFLPPPLSTVTLTAAVKPHADPATAAMFDPLKTAASSASNATSAGELLISEVYTRLV